MSPQIYLQFADFAGNPLFSSVPGVPPAFAYWLPFTGAFDEFGRRIYDFWIDQGSGFFFVEQLVVSTR